MEQIEDVLHVPPTIKHLKLYKMHKKNGVHVPQLYVQQIKQACHCNIIILDGKTLKKQHQKENIRTYSINQLPNLNPHSRSSNTKQFNKQVKTTTKTSSSKEFDHSRLQNAK